MNAWDVVRLVRPNAATSGAPRGIGWLLGLALATALSACGVLDTAPAAAVRAPAWEPLAFGTSDADLVGAIDLAAVREDPVFAPLVAQLAHEASMGVLARASQIDLIARLEQGEMASWVAVVHGVDGAPTRADVGQDASKAITAPGQWWLGEGPAFERLRAGPGLASPRIALPARAVLASTLKGRAIPRPREAELVDLTEGLEDVTMIILGGAHLEISLRCRYSDATAARHAATAAKLVLVAEAERTDAVSALARELAKVDFDARGDDVSVRLTVSDDLRELLQRYVERAVR